DKKVSKRNYSITKANAFNDIFLDSNAVENYITKNSLPDSVANLIRSFYNTRNYEFAWFSSAGLSEQAMGFSSLKNFTGDTSAKQKKLQKTIDNLLADDEMKVSAKSPSIINTELMLTESLIDYGKANFDKGYVKRKELERFIPFKKSDPLKLADSLLNKKHSDDKYFSDINKPYKLLLEQLKKYADIAKAGGWPSIAGTANNFKEGASSPEIISIKKLFSITGDLPVKDSSSVFDDNFKKGVLNFQKRFGQTADGKITAATLEEMKVPVIARIKQILINMNRMRWLPLEPESKLIVVNIPAFLLHVYDKKQEVFSMPVIVGKEGHNTTLFSDRLSTIVFSPYWNIPQSIVKNEIVPGIAKNKNYLADHQMETTGTEDGFPIVRQLPGPKNSLGKVKFLFPNIFNIYFHDTPAKSIFDKDVRAYSHGCIRLSDPLKLATYLLKGNDSWTSQNIEKAMDSGKEQYVALKDPVPVFITYYTAWVDENGQLNFRDDIYGHDLIVGKKMF
ncbi:MAG: L,D-transpeptidase family protein, partial [Ferruginibacter sp.]